MGGGTQGRVYSNVDFIGLFNDRVNMRIQNRKTWCGILLLYDKSDLPPYVGKE